MKSILRNIFAVVLGVVVGGGVNMALVELGPLLVPPPAGVDVSNVDSINESIHLYQPKHYISPFLAHALGTMVGALVAFVAAGTRKDICAFAVGVLFLAGGIAAATMISAPTWFVVLDLVVAYLPMAWLGIRFGERFTSRA